MSDDLSPPRPSAGDIAYGFVRGAISSVPYVGGFGAELLSSICAAPYQRRLAEWIEHLAATVKEVIDARARTVEELRADEEFIDLIFESTQIAIRNHRAEKRRMLLTAVKSSATSNSLLITEKKLFLRLLDKLDVAHLKMLQVLDDPVRAIENSGVVPNDGRSYTIHSVVELVGEGLRDRRDLCAIIYGELSDARLVKEASDAQLIYGTFFIEPQATELGRRFLRFIGL